MLTLLSPAALWSLAALAIPLTLHLWRQPPRTVRLPSLRFLQTQVGRKLQNLRWRERLLLLVRLGLLAALALLLARPQWAHSPPRTPQRWILLDPTAASDGPSLARLRTLQADGYATHLLAPGLPVVSQVPTTADVTVAPDLWSLVREADAMLPAGSTLAVFSSTRLASLHGLRPALRAKLDWIKTLDLTGDAAQAWIAAVHPAPSPAQTPVVTVGVSDADRVRFNASPPVGWKLETRPDAARLLSPANDTTPWTKASSPVPLSVLILHDSTRTDDARYLAAAVRAAVQTTARPLDLHSADANTNPAILPATEWTFWLSAAAPPALISHRNTRLFEDAPHPDASAPDWIVPQPNTPGEPSLTPPVRLWRRGSPPGGAVLWTDAHGSPLLTFTHDISPHWNFASRFHPDWTDLPRTTVFSAWLQALLLGDPPLDARHDLRLADAQQAQPSLSTQEAAPGAVLPLPTSPVRDLHPLFWSLAAILFLLERFLSHSHRPAATPLKPTAQPEPVSAR